MSNTITPALQEINKLTDKWEASFKSIDKIAVDIATKMAKISKTDSSGLASSEVETRLRANSEAVKVLNQQLERQKQINQQLQTALDKLKAKRSSHGRRLTEEEKLLKKVQKEYQELKNAMSDNGKELVRLRNEKNKVNKETRDEDKLNSKSTSTYDKVSLKLNKLINEYREIAIKKEAGIRLSIKEGARMLSLERRIGTYDRALKRVDASSGRFNRNVGNYKAGFDGLGFSVAQLTREMPAFANSMQTGFMAISNNIPMLTDEINKLRVANKQLASEGKPTENILRKLGGAMFSWHTLISVGVTLLTVYGAELFDLAFGMSETEKATKKANEEIEENNKQLKENISLRKQLLKDVSSFLNVNTRALRQALEGTFGDTEKQALILQEIADRFNEASIENADLLNNETLTQQSRVKVALNLLAIEKLKNDLAEERLRVDNITKKQNEIKEKFTKGEITALQKKKQLEKLSSNSLNKTLDLQARINAYENENLAIKNSAVVIQGDANDGKDEENEKTEKQVSLLKEWIESIKEINRLRKERFDSGVSFGEQSLSNDPFLEGLVVPSDEETINALNDALEKTKERLDAIKDSQDDLLKKETLLDALGGLEQTLQIQSGTFEKLFNQIESGFDDAGESARAFGEIAKGAFATITQASNQRAENELRNLEIEKETALQFAGDSVLAKEQIEQEYDDKQKAIRRKQAEQDRNIALFNIAVDTASGIVNAASKVATIPLIPFIAGIGLAQAAVIASAPLPEFKDGHLEGTYEGFAKINDEKSPLYREIVARKDGSIDMYKKRDQIIHMNKGDKVLPAKMSDGIIQDMKLRGVLDNLNISMSKQTVNSISKSDLREVMNQTLAKQPQMFANFDKDGIITGYRKGHTLTILKDNSVRFK